MVFLIPHDHNTPVTIPPQNSKEHTRSLRERVGREVEKAKSWKLGTEKSVWCPLLPSSPFLQESSFSQDGYRMKTIETPI